MNTNVKPAIGFLTKDSDARLDQDVETIITSMTGNANFATPSPTLAVISTALSAFTVALAGAADGGIEKTAIKNARRAELVSLLRQLASYVFATANGDMTKLLSSGFPAQKTSHSPIGPLPAPTTPFLSQGPVTGSLSASTPPVNGSYIYNWRVALASAPAVYVKQVQSTAASNTFEDLTPGQIYDVQLNAVGTAGTSDWSGPGELMIT
jgi:hypothetical protein